MMLPNLPSVATAESDATGTSGASIVKGWLQALRQGVNLAPENDVGTDFHMELRRPSTGEGIGLTIGGQIKSGISFFDWKGATAEDGDGWWFYEKKGNAHFGLWSLSSIPYILVLYNPTTKLAHWVNVTEPAIVETDTDEGKKILVPTKNVIGAAAIDQLIEIAINRLLRNPYQGTIWRTTDLRIEEPLLYRVALIAPRLVSPHPNQGPLTPADPGSGLGILLTGFSHYMRDEEPPEGEVPAKEGWGWKFFDALIGWLKGEGDEAIRSALADAVQPEQRAACAVLLTAALVDLERPRDALGELRVLDLTGMSETDLCWLKAHEAQILYDLGMNNDALDVTTLWLGRAKRISGDITLEPIIASLTSVVFHLSEWEQQDVKELIQTRDNLSAWWRSFSVEGVLFRESISASHGPG